MKGNSQMRRAISVVGASTSGLLAARLLASRGQDVTVFERTKVLEPVDRTLIVTARYRDWVGAIGESAIVNEIDRYELFANGRVAEFKLREPDLIVERSILIRHLAKSAEEAGAVIELDQRITDLGEQPEGIRLEVKDGSGQARTVGSRVVIGADGTSSMVAQCSGLGRQPTVPLLQAIVELPQGYPTNTVQVWFRPVDTPFFYWLLPESKSRGALGVIGLDQGSIRSQLDRFLEEKGFSALEYQAASIPRYGHWAPIHKKLGEGDIFVVGDAAGHVKVSTVGGLVTGFRGAIGVAETICSGRHSSELRKLRLELLTHLMVHRTLSRFSEDDYVRLIELIRGRTARSIGVHTRDESGKLLLRAVAAEPRFALMGLRALLAAGGPWRR